MHAAVIEQRKSVVVPPERLLREIRGEKRNSFRLALGLRIFLEIFCFGGKADAERTLGQRRHLPENVRVGRELDAELAVAALDLL